MRYGRFFITFLLLLWSYLSFSQHFLGERLVLDYDIETDIQAREFLVYYIDSKEASKIFTKAEESNLDTQVDGFERIMLPNPKGEWVEFHIYNSGVMHPGLKRKFPELSAVSGHNPERPSVRLKSEASPYGFRAMVSGGAEGTYFIDPVRIGEDSLYMVYYKKDFTTDKTFTCHTTGNDYDPLDYEPWTTNSITIVQNVRREYRLAVSTTAQYAAFHGGTKPSVMAAIITTINRVNSVYERDFSIRLNLVVNNDLLIFLSTQNQPFINNSSTQMLSQNTSVINGIIGSANYDIGHVFSTGGGGVAYLGCVCRNNKGGGVTGQSAPINDPFDIDYVAHEMGHQFGANHTQNNPCNRNSSTAFEPGSASTIMGYAGICPPNLQNNSDDHFHIGSIMEVRNYAFQGQGNSCANQIITNNLAPTVAIEERDVFLPRQTPFVLRANAIDPEGDDVTYCWEQFDLGPAGNPMTPVGNAPLFRSFSPVEEGERFFPRFVNVRFGVSTIGELLPSYGRNMRFRVTVRDNNPLGGANAYNEILLTVDNNAGPFVVTAPANNQTVRSSRFARISWDVAGTDLAPINCSEVDIYLSINDGVDFPFYIGRRQNNGEALVVIPPKLSTATARFKVEGVNKYFYNLSPRFTLSDPLIGLDEWSLLNDLVELYPNPGSDYLNIAIQTDNVQHVQVEMYNMQGKQVATQSELKIETAHSELRLNTTNLAPGLYLIRIGMGGEWITKRWIKAH